MRIARIVIVVALVVVLVAVVGGVGTLAWITGRAMPQTSGTLQAPGLEGQVTVARDVHGIAQITAATPHDLFFTQGYVHAQERMWQMEVWRHISSGRLSELFGEGTLDTDKFIRTLGWRRAAERDLPFVPPDTRAILDAYAAGVNAWLDANRGDLGLAFLVTGADPEPWTVLDSLAWGKVQAWNLGGNIDTEIFRYLADARLGDPSRTDELLAPPDSPPVITPSGLAGSGGAGAGTDRRRTPRRRSPRRMRARRRSWRRWRRARRPPTPTPTPVGAPSWRSPMTRCASRGSTPAAGSRPTARWAPTTGRSVRRCRPRAARSLPTTRISGSPCRRSGSSTACTARRSTMHAPTTWPASASRACRASSSATTRGSRGARRTSIPTSRTSCSRPSIRPTPRTTSAPTGSPCRSRCAPRRSALPGVRRSSSRSARRRMDRSSTGSTTGLPTRP